MNFMRVVQGVAGTRKEKKMAGLHASSRKQCSSATSLGGHRGIFHVQHEMIQHIVPIILRNLLVYN